LAALWSVFLWNDPQRAYWQKWGLPAQENQDFEVAPVSSQSPMNTAVGDMSAPIFVNL
jgi:hypothetical protein